MVGSNHISTTKLITTHLTSAKYFYKTDIDQIKLILNMLLQTEGQ
jgi:hypothetical protein